MDCIDHWLEKHSSCPLCRHKVNSEDQTMFTYSNSMRLLLGNQSELGDEPNIEIFVQREEEDERHGSSRFSIGSSFRKFEKGIIKEEELPIQEDHSEEEEKDGGGEKLYHKHKHKITVSDVVFKHRWSNVTSSDLMFLNSEMVHAVHSERFNLLESNGGEEIPLSRSVQNENVIDIKEEMERKISFETKVGTLNNKMNSTFLDTSDCAGASSSSGNTHTSKYVNPGDKRCMSEITGVSRFGDMGMKNRALKESCVFENNVKEERMRQLWLPIARRTVQWFVNRERRSQPLDV